ncbi:hypothetical protein JCGZ_12489 [Jatropha curcas]|uniref:Uncharacterized protein n=1 Tax=Jatropha curcas TaxID=180498 RepID=A0A067KAI1_JATCU|nr:hypothetical protein JCGZ_12489 [Jatropha curcas]
MGPDLEKSKALASKDNGGVSQVQEDKFAKCISNYEDNNFHEEALNYDQAKLSEDMDINIIECTKSGDNGQIEARCEDATESMSSFGDTLSETENLAVLGDAEVESQCCLCDAAASVFDGGAFQMRRKKLTDHWRRFIRPLMWRCKWIELQIKEFQSQALKYDRELAEHEQRKQFDYGTFLIEGIDAKSTPFSSCTKRNKVMKRKKRKRIEEATDISSYMLQHNLFSYYETRKSSANGASMNDNCSNNPDKAINVNDEFGFQDGWASLETKGIDNICENILLKIEALQLLVRKLKVRIEKVTKEGILINNQAAKEEMQDLNMFRNEVTEKHQVETEEQTSCVPEATNISTGTTVPRVNFGGKTLPKSRSNLSNDKKKTGRRKSGRGGRNRKS